MAKNTGRGAPPPPRGGYRGRPGGGRGGGRGGFRGGRGGPPAPNFGGAGRGGYHTISEMDGVYLVAEDRQHPSQTRSGASTPRGRGYRGGYNNNRGAGYNTPNGGAPRGRGRGLVGDYLSPYKRGHGGIGDHSPRGGGKGRGGRLRSDAPLSDLLYQERPLLRPVIFVRSTLTATLFQEEEEIFKPGVEEIGDGEQSHVPTADRVFRLFSGGNIPAISDSENDEEQLEEIDFNDTEKLLEPPTSAADLRMKKDVEVMEEQFTGIYINREPAGQNMDIVQEDTVVSTEDGATATSLTTLVSEGISASELLTKAANNTDMDIGHVTTTTSSTPSAPTTTTASAPAPETPEEGLIGFYIDTEPSKVEDLPPPPPPLTDDDDEVIIYVAPHPRFQSGGHTPARAHLESSPAPMAEAVFALPTTSILTGMKVAVGTDSLSASGVSERDEEKETTTTTPVVDPTPQRVPTPPAFSSVSFSQLSSSSATATAAHGISSASLPMSRVRQIPAFTAGGKSKAALKQRKQEARARRKREEREEMRRGMFGEEAGGGGHGVGGKRGKGKKEVFDPDGPDERWEERRRGDSDVDWGDEEAEEDDKDGSKLKAGSGAEGMLVDEDISLDAMKAFVEGMSGERGGQFVTMDDIRDDEMMRREDEEGVGQGGVGSSAEEDEEEEREERERLGGRRAGDNEEADEDSEGEGEDEDDIDAVVNAEAELMIAEQLVFDGLDDDEDEVEEEDEVSDDDVDVSPGANFQARLERLRVQARNTPSKSKGKGKMQVEEFSEDEDEDDAFLHNLSWAEQDEEFIAHIQDIMDENEAILTGRDRKVRKQLFNAIRDGEFDELDDFQPARKKKDKYKDLPPELQAQWNKDREKKAEYKHARELAKLEAAADPLVRKKGGKKGKKAMLAVARADPTIVVLPNRIIDMTTLVQQIRRFIADVGGPGSMPLPPTNKETRKAIHEMAQAFNLKSKSDGKGDARYTTLKKTTRSQLPPDEWKIAKIMRRFGRGGGGEFVGGGGNGQGKMPKHKEGDEVGKHAPKIGDSNIGFKMLSLMGWSEGDKIGVSGGLDAPITALFKTSKLGLGATRS